MFGGFQAGPPGQGAHFAYAQTAVGVRRAGFLSISKMKELLSQGLMKT